MNKSFWFFLESYIYVTIKSNVMLVYDTHTGKNLSVKSEVAIQIVRKIYEDKNLGCIELKLSDLDNPDIYIFVNAVIINGMGKLLDSKEYPIKPIILLPILSLNFDIDKFSDKEDANIFLYRNISKYLLDVNIILNNSCEQQCLNCHEYCKQFFCCSRENIPKSLSEESLINLLCEISYYPVRTINITGGNIYQYKNLKVFNSLGKNSGKKINFYLHYLNYQENSYIDKQSIHLFVNTPINSAKINAIQIYAKKKNIKYHLIVENKEQYEELESIMHERGIKDFEVHPFYNGHNVSFFEENVYLSKEDILTRPIPMREIFRNQKLNVNFFGSLYIFPNGEIKANFNEKTIGNLEKDKIIDVINYEMMQNTAWRKVRSANPCANCVYQYLCPPLSNYEKTLNKQNLCHIHF